jgi:ataxia telangiectasia mutated family protein
MTSLPNLQPALRLYASDKVKDRSQGSEIIREIFSNKENLQIFQETASRESGTGWLAFFQCLFQVVVTEKKGVLKANATVQGSLYMFIIEFIEAEIQYSGSSTS